MNVELREELRCSEIRTEIYIKNEGFEMEGRG